MRARNPLPVEDRAIANTAAEAAVLGAMMMDSRTIDHAADLLRHDDFYLPLHARVFSAIVVEHSKGRPATPHTLRPYFERDPDCPEGPKFLIEYTASLAPLMGWKELVQQVREVAKRRRLADGLIEAAASAGDNDVAIEALVDMADAAISTTADRAGGAVQVTGGEALGALMASFDEPQTGALSEALPSINDLLGPARPSQLIITAGRPGMGKTATALSYAIGAARRGHGVLFVSLEMGAEELAARMAADMCFDGVRGVPFEAIRDNRLTRDHRRAILAAKEEMDALPFEVLDVGKLTIGRLSMCVRRCKRRMAAQGKSLDLVVVDYLQLMSPDERMRSAYEAVSEVSKGLKAIAKDQRVAVMALAQLSREAERRENKRPLLSDLRDSGQIEQDADAVLFLYRHEYYLQQAEPAENDPKYDDWRRAMDASANVIEFICAKRRNGRTGSAKGQFWGGNQAVRG